MTDDRPAVRHRHRRRWNDHTGPGRRPDGAETGEAVRNYDFHHSPAIQARSLAYNTIHALLAGEAEANDAEFVASLLDFWNMGNLEELRTLGRQGFVADRFERSRRFGELAPLVTAAALQGIPLACRECDGVVQALSRSIRLVGGCFEKEVVPVVLIGSLIRSPYLQNAMARTLVHSEAKRFDIVEPAFSGEVGAALLALQILGIEMTDALRAMLLTPMGS